MQFIDLVDDTGRTTSLTVNSNSQTKLFRVVGNLPHCLQFSPKTVADAQMMIAKLKDWVDDQPLTSCNKCGRIGSAGMVGDACNSAGVCKGTMQAW